MTSADLNAPRRRPPPPPRLQHTVAAPYVFLTAAPRAWPPRGPPIAPPFGPPRPPYPAARNGPPPIPWAMPPRPPRPPPPRFSMQPQRPPMPQAMIYRPAQLPLRPPHFAPPSAPMRPAHDPDAPWLAAFTAQHLHKTPATTTDTLLKCEPPLRHLRERLADLRAKLDELEVHARELIAIEHKIAAVDSREAGGDNALVVARLKAQAERKRHQCEQLRDALDRLQDPQPLGLGTDLYRDALAFTKRIKKKKAYRLRRKEKLRAEHTILQQLQDQEETQPQQESVGVKTTTNSPPAQDDAAVHAAVEQVGDTDRMSRRHRYHECEAARKVLLALDLREARRGEEWSDRERAEIYEARAVATACLRRKRRRKKRRRAKCVSESEEAEEESTPMAGPGLRSTSSSHVLPLRDPYATDMETLIAVRRLWDRFLVPPIVHGGSAIPPHFVSPPINPPAPWALFVRR